MLDYQNVVLAREISHERVHGLPTSAPEFLGMTPIHGMIDGWRRLAAFLVMPVNMMSGQRLENKHRSLEGTT